MNSRGEARLLPHCPNSLKVAGILPRPWKITRREDKILIVRHQRSTWKQRKVQIRIRNSPLSTPIFAMRDSLESSRRDLLSTLRSTWEERKKSNYAKKWKWNWGIKRASTGCGVRATPRKFEDISEKKIKTNTSMYIEHDSLILALSAAELRHTWKLLLYCTAAPGLESSVKIKFRNLSLLKSQ